MAAASRPKRSHEERVHELQEKARRMEEEAARREQMLDQGYVYAVQSA